MKQPIVYLDTSFFIGLLENVANRRDSANSVLTFERKKTSRLYTSILTVNEYLIKYYNHYRKQANCEEKIDEALREITDIATIYAVSLDVNKEAARLMSIWGEYRKIKGESPSSRKFRWDAYHIATAHVLRADRVHAYDGPWDDFPKNEIPNIKDIIVPARVVLPAMPLLDSLKEDE